MRIIPKVYLKRIFKYTNTSRPDEKIILVGVEKMEHPGLRESGFTEVFPNSDFLKKNPNLKHHRFYSAATVKEAINE